MTEYVQKLGLEDSYHDNTSAPPVQTKRQRVLVAYDTSNPSNAWNAPLWEPTKPTDADTQQTQNLKTQANDNNSITSHPTSTTSALTSAQESFLQELKEANEKR